MTPFLVAGAVSLAKYVVDRIDARVGGSSSTSFAGPGGTNSDFSSALRAVRRSGAGGLDDVHGSAGEPSRQLPKALEAQVINSPEVQAALRILGHSGLLELEVRSDGKLLLHSDQGVQDIVPSEETRVLGQRLYRQSVGQMRAGGEFFGASPLRGGDQPVLGGGRSSVYVPIARPWSA